MRTVWKVRGEPGTCKDAESDGSGGKKRADGPAERDLWRPTANRTAGPTEEGTPG